MTPPDTLTTRIAFRVTEEERDIFNRAARESKRSRNSFFRMMIQGLAKKQKAAARRELETSHD